MSLANISEEQLKKAVALFYDGHAAPVVSAKGEGSLANDIIDIAQQCGVPLCDNAALVDLLITLELGDTIPEALYISVATIIAFAYQLRGLTPEQV